MQKITSPDSDRPTYLELRRASDGTIIEGTGTTEAKARGNANRKVKQHEFDLEQTLPPMQRVQRWLEDDENDLDVEACMRAFVEEFQAIGQRFRRVAALEGRMHALDGNGLPDAAAQLRAEINKVSPSAIASAVNAAVRMPVNKERQEREELYAKLYQCLPDLPTGIIQWVERLSTVDLRLMVDAARAGRVLYDAKQVKLMMAPSRPENIMKAGDAAKVSELLADAGCGSGHPDAQPDDGYLKRPAGHPLGSINDLPPAPVREPGFATVADVRWLLGRYQVLVNALVKAHPEAVNAADHHGGFGGTGAVRDVLTEALDTVRASADQIKQIDELAHGRGPQPQEIDHERYPVVHPRGVPDTDELGQRELDADAAGAPTSRPAQTG